MTLNSRDKEFLEKQAYSEVVDAIVHIKNIDTLIDRLKKTHLLHKKQLLSKSEELSSKSRELKVMKKKLAKVISERDSLADKFYDSSRQVELLSLQLSHLLATLEDLLTASNLSQKLYRSSLSTLKSYDELNSKALRYLISSFDI